MDGCRSSAISPIGIRPYDTIVTEARIAKTLRKPRTVARPTSSRRWTCREWTLAPSTPENTPAPTIGPTTMVVSVGRVSLAVVVRSCVAACVT
jgi:hypothetical protein